MHIDEENIVPLSFTRRIITWTVAWRRRASVGSGWLSPPWTTSRSPPVSPRRVQSCEQTVDQQLSVCPELSDSDDGLGVERTRQRSARPTARLTSERSWRWIHCEKIDCAFLSSFSSDHHHLDDCRLPTGRSTSTSPTCCPRVWTPPPLLSCAPHSPQAVVRRGSVARSCYVNFVRTGACLAPLLLNPTSRWMPGYRPNKVDGFVACNRPGQQDPFGRQPGGRASAWRYRVGVMYAWLPICVRRTGHTYGCASVAVARCSGSCLRMLRTRGSFSRLPTAACRCLTLLSSAGSSPYIPAPHGRLPPRSASTGSVCTGAVRALRRCAMHWLRTAGRRAQPRSTSRQMMQPPLWPGWCWVTRENPTERTVNIWIGLIGSCLAVAAARLAGRLGVSRLRIGPGGGLCRTSHPNTPPPQDDDQPVVRGI